MIFLKRYRRYCIERDETDFCDYVTEINKIHYYHHNFKSNPCSKMRYSSFYFRFANYTIYYTDYYTKNGGKFIIIRTKKYLVEVNLSNESIKKRLKIRFTRCIEFSGDFTCFD